MSFEQICKYLFPATWEYISHFEMKFEFAFRFYKGNPMFGYLVIEMRPCWICHVIYMVIYTDMKHGDLPQGWSNVRFVVWFAMILHKKKLFWYFNHSSYDYSYMHQLWNHIYYTSTKDYQYCSTLNLCNPCYGFHQTLWHRLLRFMVKQHWGILVLKW